jgi:hypothetical protein
LVTDLKCVRVWLAGQWEVSSGFPHDSTTDQQLQTVDSRDSTEEATNSFSKMQTSKVFAPASKRWVDQAHFHCPRRCPASMVLHRFHLHKLNGKVVCCKAGEKYNTRHHCNSQQLSVQLMVKDFSPRGRVRVLQRQTRQHRPWEINTSEDHHLPGGRSQRHHLMHWSTNVFPI